MLSHFLRAAEKPTLNYLAAYTDTSSQTTRTISSVNFGDPASTREIFVVVRYSNSTATTISSATIGGVSATISAGASAGAQGAALIFATVPTGTSGNVVITYSNATTNATTNSVAFVYRVTKRQNIGTTAINTYGDTGGVTRTSYTSPTVAFPSNGFVLAILSHNSTTDLTFSASRITVNGDVYLDGNRAGLSYNNIGTSSFSGTYTVTWGGTSGTTLSRIWTFN